MRASDRQHQTDLQIAGDQQKENALQTYLDRMSELLLNNNLRKSQPGDEVRNVARARTITVLPQLDGVRKGELVHFLREAGLIDSKNTIVSLDGADLTDIVLPFTTDSSGTNLSDINLSGANLFRAELGYANLNGANLNGILLFETDLKNATLIHANLSSAHIDSATLTNANLTGATLTDATLTNANLSKADLRGANLNGALLCFIKLSNDKMHMMHITYIAIANLSGSNLRDADLNKAWVTQEQLKEVESLQGAIMPDGSKHP
jgi:uncharacterized protein YjbI with pentapeptide repeats